MSNVNIFNILNESFEATIKENKEKSLKESQKLNPNNLTKEQLWKLREEIVLGSLYLDDYKNSFGIDPQAVCNFFDSFIEDAQQDDEGNYNNRETKDFDNAEELYNYYLSCENPFGDLEESQKLNETTDNAVSKLISGEPVYFRDRDGSALVVSYADVYPEPEEYDEGYTKGWERGADEEFDKEQDEKFEKAKKASEEGTVWHVLYVDEDTLEPNGDVYGYIYGADELNKVIPSFREVKVKKSLEESKNSIEEIKAKLKAKQDEEKDKMEVIYDTDADKLIKDYYNHKMDLPELHDKLEKLFGNKKKAVEYFAANDERIKKSMKEPVKEAAKGKTIKLVKEDDTILVNASVDDPDYVITDVTELDDVNVGDVQSPDIDALLTMIQESINEKYGEDTINIHIHSSNLIENGSFALVDIKTPEILKEFAKLKSKDQAIGKSLILEQKQNDLFEFRVNNISGTTKYIKRTKEPAKAIMEWLETEFLSEAKKAKEEEKKVHYRAKLEDTLNQFLAQNNSLQLAVDTIKMYIDAVGKDCKETVKSMIDQLMVEFPHSISTSDDSLKFDSNDDIIEILFGKEWTTKESKEDIKATAPGSTELKRKISESEFYTDKAEEIYELVQNNMTNEERKNIYKKVNKEEVTSMEAFWDWFEGLDSDEIVEYFDYLKKSTLKESYQQFNIGEIEVVYNPETQEVMYSIGADDTHDKKMNLSKIPSVETPYNTETIIKNYIEKQYGPIPQEVENDIEEPEGENLPIETQEEPIEEAEEDINVGIEPEGVENTEDTPVEDKPQAETGSAKFQKIKPSSRVSVEELRDNIKEGTVQADSSYIVVEERELPDEEFNNFTDDISAVQDFFTGITPLDRKNYAFNVIKITNSNSNFSILADPVGYNYARYVAIVDNV